MLNSYKTIFVVAALFLCVALWVRCMQNDARPDPRGTAFAPASSCRQCHQAVYDSSLSTAHHLASAGANATTLLGNFKQGQNAFAYNTQQKIVAEKRDSGFYQVLYTNGVETEAHRFDISFGTTHAQTSLYWQDDVAYELPLSFYSRVQSWATSPGFSASSPNFKRLIGRDCFECHSAFISHKKDPAVTTGDYFSPAAQLEKMEKRSLIYGIDCQRCHGPAADHVNFHQQHPAEKNARFMVAIASLGRQQQLDMCAQCHSGNDRRKLKSRFEFMPGNDLRDFFLSTSNSQAAKEPDVHGNQLKLLSQSACFLQSSTMTCSSCHGPHEKSGKGKLLYSQKCVSCHSEATHNFCTSTSATPAVLQQNCIDCHMPKRSSEAINFQLAGSSQLSSYLLTTHRIAVYDSSVGKR